MNEKRRKKIGVFVVNPEIIYQHRLITGIMTQCERYDYDMLCFTPLRDIWTQSAMKNYLAAELNIFNLVNYDMLDGIIVGCISLKRNDNISEIDKLAATFKEKFKDKPVMFVDLDYPLEGAETVFTQDTPAFRKITSHVLDIHGVEPDEIYFLAAQKGLEISDNRITGFREEIESRGFTVNENNIFYGDFWYGSGADLADRIVKGELKKPKAIICANDHMAIGLTNRLMSNGVAIPEEIIIMGYDATQDAALCETPITSFEPNVAGAGAEAVNRIHTRIDPDTPEIPVDDVSERNLCIGSSCGCQVNIDFVRTNFKTALYRQAHDYTQGYMTSNTNDMSTLFDSYMLEKMTETQTPDECLETIYGLTYLTRPFRHFYICLRPDWLNTYKTLNIGYPSQMREVLHALPGEEIDGIDPFCSDTAHNDFPTEELLPQLDAPRDKGCVFYFAPVHFQGDTLGYCVLQCDYESRAVPNVVFRNWVRNINTGLEMVRIQNRLLSYSLFDSMTGLYNRRGMDRAFTHLCRKANEGDQCLICVVDMNWLKKINDGFGHPEGDFAIQLLARCVGEIAHDERMFAVRAGGDEFFVIGMGKFEDNVTEQMKKSLLSAVERSNNASGKPYRVSASIGSCLKPYTKGIKLEELIHEADGNMYQHKRMIKQNQSFE